MEVLRERLGGADSVLGRVGVELAGGRVPDCGAVAGGPELLPVGHREGRIDAHRPRALVWDVEGRDERVRPVARGPDERLRPDRLTGRQLDAAGFGVGDARAELERHAPFAHSLERVRRQRLAQFGEDPVPGVDGDHADLLRRDPRVVREHPPGEVVERAGQFRSREPGAGDDERDQRPTGVGVVGRIGPLEARDDVVSNGHCVPERLEIEDELPVGIDPLVVGHRTQREDEMVVGHRRARGGRLGRAGRSRLLVGRRGRPGRRSVPAAVCR